MSRLIIGLLLLIHLTTGCYSFKGISIPPEVNTFIVLDFINKVNDAPLDVEIEFGEQLRRKVRTESRLKYNEVEPDIQFEGSIVQFFETFEAPKEGTTVDLGKLTIGVEVSYTSNLNEKDNWKKTFTKFRTYDSTVEFNDIKDDLIDEIFDQITEAVFNEAFTDW